MNGNDCFKNGNDCFKWQRPFRKGKIAAASDVIYLTIVAMETNYTTWFRLIESTNEACCMYQISSQSDELCRK